jgi:hypothetical protein
MHFTLSIFAGCGLALALATAAAAGPDLKPKFSSASGQVRVTNVGDADAPASWVTVVCSASGGGQCPDPAPADAAPYLNAAFPNSVAIAVPDLGAGAQHAHVIDFYDALVFAPGSYTFMVCADAGNDVAEDSERNNCVQVKKSVRGGLAAPGGLSGNTPTN